MSLKALVILLIGMIYYSDMSDMNKKTYEADAIILGAYAKNSRADKALRLSLGIYVKTGFVENSVASIEYRGKIIQRLLKDFNVHEHSRLKGKKAKAYIEIRFNKLVGISPTSPI